MKVIYFKESGKYYSEGTYHVPVMSYYETIEYIKDQLRNNNWPGLKGWCDGFSILIMGTGHPNGYPVLIHSRNL